jgi:surface antigen
MYNRECVSYTAFRVAASGRYMPFWGGVGNANQWDDNARAIGIPVDSNPRAGDVAIKNSMPYGHAMYVESVNGNGTINISQYNAALDGRYSTNTISPSGLVFIHF